MKTETAQEKDSAELAKDAVNYILERVRDDENIRYHMGAFTEAFDRLKAAHSAGTGISQEAIEQAVFSKPLKRKAAAQKLDEIKTLVEKYDTNYDDKGLFISEIRTHL